ncbi:MULTISPECIES: TetR/AcrR family transcriptional regulator [Roseateles]|uniref:TetR/AcrR family transcriptional regulator n=1 Tax=Pelomonas caseinilytica TaxID=2906763 RepID=A0ABS8XIE6_9BURK|nr:MULTISPECIES: TetR/AcrR family transcriptional regulator [unclassified Roseateles]MCE4540634.1 TetR/AcrR family transcriptional regulator [Pelomonas sp. P7]HEV6967674.1 TetR/AcrR family transcriptional regulator [Roseateles sp.]
MSRTEQKAQTRQRIVEASGRGFKRGGFGGIGIDGLAKEAGVTSGAFYVHFSSKEAAFKEAVLSGIDELRAAVERLRATSGAQWVEALVDFYLGYKRVCELGDSCAMQSLIPEVGRAGDHIKAAVQEHMIELAQAIADGLPEGKPEERLERAWALMALLSGGVTLARATSDPGASEAIANAVRRAALQVGLAPAAPAPRGSRIAQVRS